MSLLSVRSPRFSIVPWLFVAGFAIVIAVNGTMMWLAIGSFSGLYSGHARERGVHYNEVVAQQRSRDALGWTVQTGWKPESNHLDLTLSDAAGRPLEATVVSVALIRPAEKRPPVGVTMNGLGGGKFSGSVVLPARGNWDADIAIEAEGHRFAITKRLFLQ
ncbi:FixH family protein [Reyranella sp.]|uniref:FixH family protein n=1 Tax=Reyranella sp. TaxID=1929291 RepID=UPI003D10D7A7